MKILYVTDQVYLHGGAEKILIQKLNYWADVLGHETILVTTNQKGQKPFTAISGKVRMHDLQIPYTEGTFYSRANLELLPKHFRSLKKIIAEIAPDAVFVLSQTLPRFITPFAAGNVPTFYELHTSYYGFELGRRNLKGFGLMKSKLISAIGRFAESKYTRIVYLNQWEFDHYKRSNAVIIPNFFDPVPEMDLPREKRVISLGRLSFQKGYDLLIEAWKLADDRLEGWSCDIYGNGDDAEKLRARIAQHHFRNLITVHAAIDDINTALATSSVYAMSSRFETFPMVLLEAMSHKLPIVAFDCPTGPRSIMSENDGIIVQPGDVSGFADALVTLCRESGLREKMGQNGFENVKRFSPASVMAMWEKLVIDNKR